MNPDKDHPGKKSRHPSSDPREASSKPPAKQPYNQNRQSPPQQHQPPPLEELDQPPPLEELDQPPPLEQQDQQPPQLQELHQLPPLFARSAQQHKHRVNAVKQYAGPHLRILLAFVKEVYGSLNKLDIKRYDDMLKAHVDIIQELSRKPECAYYHEAHYHLNRHCANEHMQAGGQCAQVQMVIDEEEQRTIYNDIQRRILQEDQKEFIDTRCPALSNLEDY
ncbi:uncharacterized protein LOC135829212 [Sycon ciliatum]|uniref:uncharacterized protein LOC135829212 n=1 Tax=Sycon ciliatum TaxID=27933 RepID=UPI0031F6832C